MIESYSFGQIKIDGQHYTTDVIIYPERVDAGWWRKEGHSLCAEDLRDIIAAKPEVLIIGCGASGVLKIPPQTQDYITSLGIELIALPTGTACRRYNELSKKKRVVAGLHLTC
jgi:hypothetical protein